MKILFSSFQGKYKEYESIFLSLLERTVLDLNFKCSPIVSVDLVDEATIHEMNLSYRHIDRATDVLSFAYLENEEDKDTLLQSKGDVEIGDILICLPIAVKQAKEFKHSEKRELSFLFVHGLLHLLGYDHQSSEEERKMFALQEKILSEMGIEK